MNAIQVQQLQFSYNKLRGEILKSITLTVEQGSRFGIFGPNGAGKTTLMSVLSGLLPYKHGSVELFGKELSTNSAFAKAMIGFVPQDYSFYEELSPAENLQFFGAWYGMSASSTRSRTIELLEVLGLSHVANQPLKQFSGGMKRRINLAIGVLNQPAILFLDEPTVGVDVQSRNAMIAYLKKINQQGTTLVYTSHQLKEAEDLCTNIALIDEGRIITSGSLSAILTDQQQDGLENLFLTLTGRTYRD